MRWPSNCLGNIRCGRIAQVGIVGARSPAPREFSQSRGNVKSPGVHSVEITLPFLPALQSFGHVSNSRLQDRDFLFQFGDPQCVLRQLQNQWAAAAAPSMMIHGNAAQSAPRNIWPANSNPNGSYNGRRRHLLINACLGPGRHLSLFGQLVCRKAPCSRWCLLCSSPSVAPRSRLCCSTATSQAGETRVAGRRSWCRVGSASGACAMS